MPPYLDEKVHYDENYRHWLRDGDVMIASAPKAGTIWLQSIVILLRNGGKDYKVIDNEMGGMELLLFPEDTVDLRLERHRKKWAQNTVQHFTHMFWAPGSKLVGLNPRINPQIKYIVILRNGKEVAQSIYHFLNSFTQEFRNLWGGFPGPVLTKEMPIKHMAKDPKMYFSFGKAWWNLRNESNVLLLHYADLKKDPR